MSLFIGVRLLYNSHHGRLGVSTRRTNLFTLGSHAMNVTAQQWNGMIYVLEL